ncbi:MAG: hypothetical protein K5931_02865 [Lachnospiraceae bacterium]|nr:hypothetical protein [Lachnospiraceae bacterium]
MCINIYATVNACTLAYFGGAYTDDGSNLFFRVEDGNTNDENKLYMVSPAGKHKAGTFIGDEDENIIDYRRSIGDYRVDLFDDSWKWSVFTREAVSLNKILNTDEYNAGNVIEDNDYVITNISKDGRIVPFYNKLDLKDTVDLDYVIELLRLYPIACPQNIETHIYRFYPDAEPDFGHASMSRKSQETALALFRHFKYGEELPDSSDNFGFDPKYVVIALCGAIALFGIIYYCIKRANRS